MSNTGNQPVPGTSRYRVNTGVSYLQNASLSTKVSKFNEATTVHKKAQQKNPFSEEGRATKRIFNKNEYGRPVAGSLTEFRGQKANLQISKEVFELCQIINSEGYLVSEDEPDLRMITFGELFQLYTHISNKVVGILLRARKHHLVDFEGEILFQRRDDDVPIYLLKPIGEIKQIVENKQDEVIGAMCSNPHPTTILQDNLSPK